MAGKNPPKKKRQDKSNLTEIQELFCLKYVELGGLSGKGAEAARQAGSKAKDPDSVAAKWLALDKVLVRITELKKKVEEKSIDKGVMGAVEAQGILDAMIRANLADYYDSDGKPKKITELTRDQIAAIEELVPSMSGNIIPRLHNKLSALDKKLRTLGLYKQTLVLEDPYMKYLAEIARNQNQEKAG